MTKIVYKPHCGKCGFPISEDVDYQDVYEGYNDSKTMFKIGTRVYPDRCPHCGEAFDCIEITPPKKKPDMYLNEE